MTTSMMVVLAIAAVAVAGALVWYFQRQKSQRLKARFGPEYDRMRDEVGDVRRAEAALAARENRVHKLHIHALSEPEKSRFAEVWRHIQTLFVDEPNGAVREADHLVNEVMTAKGYPIADFNQRSADISVDHPIVMEHYRAARSIAERNETGAASTEDLRQAVIHYRALFDDLLEQKQSESKRVHTRR